MKHNTPYNKSHMKYAFSTVPTVSHRRSRFKMLETHKTTFDAGFLIPFFVKEVLPGDTFSVNSTILARLATPIYPLMDNIYIDTHFFYVPNRLLWENWEKFTGAQDNPGDSVDFLTPQVTADAGGFDALSIFDYMGLPTGVANISVNAFHPRAYKLIWNEWFRDQNLQDSVDVPVDDGPDTESEYTLLRRGKRHDYFTSCLPFPQKGADVELPLGSSAPVRYDVYSGSSAHDDDFAVAEVTTPGVSKFAYGESYGSKTGDVPSTTGSNLYADLSTATASTINALRFAFQYQRKLERDARSGTRYVEHVAAHWGVTCPDFRLQRPEYLGGGSQRMGFETVPNTNITGSNGADLSAFGISIGGRHSFVKSFVEHGVIIGLLSARSDLTYQYGIERMWSRRTFNDYYLPVFAHLGEQAVLNKEIFAQGTSADDDAFGYQERWAEYRFGFSKISGLFRSVHPQTLDSWHLSQKFTTLPALNASFIEDSPPIDRVIEVTSENHFKMDSATEITLTRIMPVNSIPGMIDHF